MPRIQFTPWKEESELLRVRGQFYSINTEKDIDLRPKACALVWVWKARGNLPHPVEATALLTDAILHDNPSKNSIFSIRATYSAAFCRFVTGLVDSKLYGPRMTMYQKAMTLGLPASFVELRHEATHRELPSLSVFREATRRSLDWLWDFYWVGLRPVESDNGRSAEEILQLLQPVQARYQELREMGSRKKPIQGSLLSTDATVSLLAGPILDLIAVLLRQDVMVPASIEHARHVFSAWDETLRSMCSCSPGFLTALIDAMSEILLLDTPSVPASSSEQGYRETVFMWLEHILTSKAWLTTRRIYLSLSYATVLCQRCTNAWKGRVQKLLRKVSNEDGGSHVSSFESATHESSKNHLMDIDVISDTGFEHGWKLADDWAPKPIGTL